MIARIAVTGRDPRRTAAAAEAIAEATALPVIGHDTTAPATGPITIDEFDLVRAALTDFEHRTDVEAPPHGFVSDGSVLRYWAWLHQRYKTTPTHRLVTRPRHLPDVVFLRGFTQAHRGIVIRHAATSYTAVVHITDPYSAGDPPEPLNATLLQALSETGLPVHLIPDLDRIPALAASLTAPAATI